MTSPSPSVAPDFDPATSPLAGPNILLMGDAGTGKTHSIGTAADAGLEVFYLGIEQGLEALLGYWTDVRPDNPKPRPVPPNVHWHKLEAPKLSFKDFAAQAKRLNTLALDTIAKAPDPSRHLYNLWERIGEVLYDFPDQRTGKTFGPVSDWKPNRMLVVDGFTGFCRAAMACVVGSRPVWNPGDYQVGQKQVEGLTRLICDNCNCWFVMIAHVEKELDPVNGGMVLTVSGIGKALSPLIPPMFSDVVWARREGTRWTWSTAASGAATKARNLPWQDNMPPTFKTIFDNWRAKSIAAQADAAANNLGG